MPAEEHSTIWFTNRWANLIAGSDAGLIAHVAAGVEPQHRVVGICQSPLPLTFSADLTFHNLMMCPPTSAIKL
jgi:hypothetical protein